MFCPSQISVVPKKENMYEKTLFHGIRQFFTCQERYRWKLQWFFIYSKAVYHQRDRAERKVYFSLGRNLYLVNKLLTMARFMLKWIKFCAQILCNIWLPERGREWKWETRCWTNHRLHLEVQKVSSCQKSFWNFLQSRPCYLWVIARICCWITKLRTLKMSSGFGEECSFRQIKNNNQRKQNSKSRADCKWEM